jgi:hypothetical protein
VCRGASAKSAVLLRRETEGTGGFQRFRASTSASRTGRWLPREVGARAASGRRPLLSLLANRAPPPTERSALEDRRAPRASSIFACSASTSSSSLSRRSRGGGGLCRRASPRGSRGGGGPRCRAEIELEEGRVTAWKSKRRTAASPCVDTRKRPRRHAEETRDAAATATHPPSRAATVAELLRAGARLHARDRGDEAEMARGRRI